LIRSDKAETNLDEQEWSIGSLLKPRSEKASPAQFPELPYVGLEHVESHTTKLLGTIPAGEMRSTAKRFYAGDVLYSRLRPYLNKVWHADRDGLCSAEFIVLPGNDRVDANFLRYRLNASDFVAFANSLNAGDRPRVDFDQIATFELPWFDLAKQRAAVAEIEKQFTRLDAGVAALRRVQANLKRYRAAVLKAACEGRLVPTEAELAKAEGRTYETGEQLLARILADRRKNWQGRGKHKEPTAPDTSNLPPLSEGWCTASVDQLCGHITSGSRDWSKFYGRGKGTFILAQNVRPMRLDLTERQAVDAPEGDAETERTRVRRDDILVTIVGAKTGDVCRIPVDLDEHFVCQSVAIIRPLIIESAKFIEMYLASQENGQEQWKRYIYGQGRPHLSFEQLKATAIQLPPLAEQARIVAEVERRLSVIEELEAAVNANLRRAGRLRNSILRKAFSN
jgi:type I restriction enzyme S subunit